MQNPYLNTGNSNNINSSLAQDTSNPYAKNQQTFANQTYPNQTYNNSYPNTNSYTLNGGIENSQNNKVYVTNQTQFDNIQIIQKPQNDPLGHLDSSLYGQARKKFIYKVYIILTIQLAITAGVCFISFYVQPFLIFQIQNQWLMWVLLVVMITVEIVIFCCPAGRRFPINIIALLIFTLCQAYIVSYICSITAHTNGGAMVIVAAVMTLAIVLGLTVYAIFTTTDFTMMWGILWILFMSLLIFGIFTGIGWSYWLYNLYCVLGVILFGIYLLYDTQLIVGGKRLQLSMDDYVIGALVLYIDIIQMFLYILALLGRR